MNMSPISPPSLFSRVQHLQWLVAVVFVVFALRLFYIQVVQHSYYVREAQKTQISKLTLFPERGKVFARDGSTGEVVPLVLNETIYTVFADPHEVKDAAKIQTVLTNVAGGEMIRDSLPYLGDMAKRYVVLARQVTRTQAELIKKENLPGVGLQKDTRRVYPEGQLASQLLGYVNTDGKGQYGLEGSMNNRLTGKTGLLQAVTDVRRIPLTIGHDNIDEPAVNGDNLVLSIDRNVQFQLEQMLQAHAEKVHVENANAVVMDPNTGQVIAMANYPTYNPAQYNKVTDYRLFQNGVTDNAYEPGSVMKTLTVASGLNEGVITPNSTFANAGGCTTVENAQICNVLRNVPATPTIQQLLTYSLNTGAVSVLRSLGGGSITKAGRDKLYDYFAHRYRFGAPTGIEQTGESAGAIVSPDDPEGGSVKYANMTFGQGMTTTMVQVLAAFSAVINGGTYYKPTLIYGAQQADTTLKTQVPTIIQKGVIAPEHSAQMRDLVWHARYDNTGKTVDPVGYHVGGKSGTAQTIDPRTGAYTSDRTIGSYLGFVGGTVPKYAIMVRMDYAEGGTFAGSIEANATFGDIAKWLISYSGITPN